MPRSLTALGLLFWVLALAPACPGGTSGDEDAGVVDGGPEDGGGADAGVDGGGEDGGTDAGCPGCGECVPEETKCIGPRLSTCDLLGRWGPGETCTEGLCRADACVPVSSCESERPSCCALPEECGALEWRFTCPECRPVNIEADCLAGSCADRSTELLDVTIRASAQGLLPGTKVAIQSAVMTLYREVSSDGQFIDCALVEDGIHDRQDPTLNVVHSRYLDYQSGTGNDLFDARMRGLPAEPNQTLVLTVYDDYQGRGRPVARACADAVTFVDGGMVIIELFELP